MHVLEAGQPTGTAKPLAPLVLLLHGFPELAYSWRHQLVALAQAGFHVVAPDQRGYGFTTGSDDRYEGQLARQQHAAARGRCAGLGAGTGL